MSSVQSSAPVERRNIVFGHSPDPDDAFMFYAIAFDRIDTGNFRIRHELKDIESLNRMALEGRLEVTAVSAHAYAHIADKYAIMGCGASVGDQYGPKVVARPGVTSLHGRRVGIPGTWTTAALVLQLWAGKCDTVVLPFDQILEAVRDGRVDAGLIIHEGQLTYRTYGLECLMDLGQWWHDTTGLPLPLGLDVVRRDLGADVCLSLSRILRDSIQYSMDNREDALTYAMQFGRGLDRALADEFVGMYVNRDTLEMGDRVVQGLEELYRRGVAAGHPAPDPWSSISSESPRRKDVRVDKIEVPITVEPVVKTKAGGVFATNHADLMNLLDRVKLQIQKLMPDAAKDFIALAQSNSIWMLTYGLACCAIEMMATGTADYDLDRLGIIPRASPRQADLIIIAGTLPIQMGDQTLRVWDQMPEPKYSIAMGVCATDGGPYTLYGYSVFPGADRKIPVNIYVTGCPPRPEALLNSLLYLREMIAKRQVHSSQVSLDVHGKPWRHHYLNGVETDAPVEVTEVRWGALAPKKTDKIEWGTESKVLGQSPETEALGTRLQEQFKLTFLDTAIPTIKVASTDLHRLAQHLKDKEGFRRLATLHATDLHGRIGLSYFIENRDLGLNLALETSVPTDKPEIDSISDLFSIADCQERKEFDLFGVIFTGHPNLTRIMTPQDWIGYPLRHDYVFPTAYHGASLY